MKKNLVPILFAAGITALSGCANNAENTRNNIRTTDVRDSVRNNVDFRDDNRLTVSERAARNVQCLTEVDRANVIIRGNIAYVTVRLSDYTGRGSGNFGTGNNGTNRTNGSNSANIGNTGINVGNAGSTGITGIGGTSVGMNGVGRTGVTGNRDGDNTGNRIINGNTKTNGTAGTTGAGSTIGITGAGGNTGAAGITGNVTGGNAGTGIAGTNSITAGPSGTIGLTGTRGNNNGDTVFEQRVANQVSNADQNVKKVYISSDANLFKQMSTYANDIHNRKNRDGFLRNFTDTTRAFFINR